MNSYEYKQAVEAALSARNFHEAFRLLRVMLPADAARLRSDLEAAQEDYNRIVDFALTGAPDPSREEQIAAVTSRIYNILDMLLREKLIPEHSSQYFSVVRTLRLRRTETLGSLIRDYVKETAAISSFASASLSKSEIEVRRKTVESLEESLFNHLWTTTPLSFDELEAVRALIDDEATPRGMKCMIVGALTMSLFQFFSEPLLLLLLSVANSCSSEIVVARATVGAVLVMARWPRRTDTAAIRNRLAALREKDAAWSADVEQTVSQIIRTADVEKITKTMREEIIPEMMKLRPDIESHIRENGLDLSDMEMNPEWEELLNKSGLSERLRKFSEMQTEGGDMFYAAFSMMKTYPFFSHISHWFIPFNPERSDVITALGHDTSLGLLLEEAPAMCDGDKYSFVLSIDSLPESQKQMVLSQLSEANIRLAEMMGGDLIPERSKRDGFIRSYVHDLYRFFNLYRRNAEFVNPFTSLVNPADIPALKPDFTEPEKIRLLGEFYFKHNHFSEALALFRLLPPDLTIHQKMGLSLRRLGRNEEALVELERAELLAPDSEWTLKMLASINFSLGNYEKSLEYYGRIERLTPDRPDIALLTAYANIRLNRFREALHWCYKAEMLDEKSTRALRPIAWCAFMTGDMETARKYYERIFRETTPDGSDYLNMGHLELAGGNIREAIRFYMLHNADVEELAKSLREDLPLLPRVGIDPSVIPLILDAIRYKND